MLAVKEVGAPQSDLGDTAPNVTLRSLYAGELTGTLYHRPPNLNLTGVTRGRAVGYSTHC
eukprot:1283282-Prymnesium_polylepis.1